MSLRFTDNPSQAPLTGNMAIPATNVGTGNDVKFGPDDIVSYCQTHMAVANGSNSGLMSGSNAGKLNNLRTRDQDDAIFAQLAQTSIPLFIVDPEDGSIEVFENLTDDDLLISRVAYGMSAGSAIMTATIDDIPITGMTNLAASTVGHTAAGTAANTLPPGSKLGLMFSSVGSAKNLRVTFRGDMQLS